MINAQLHNIPSDRQVVLFKQLNKLMQENELKELAYYIVHFTEFSYKIHVWSVIFWLCTIQFKARDVIVITTASSARFGGYNLVWINVILSTVATMLQSFLCIITISYTLSPEMLSTNHITWFGSRDFSGHLECCLYLI